MADDAKERKERSDQLMRWLRTRVPKPIVCPVCGQTSWQVSGEVFELREFKGGQLVVGGVPILPVIPITCDVCAYTQLFNALLAGVIEQPTEGEPSAPSDSAEGEVEDEDRQ